MKRIFTILFCLILVFFSMKTKSQQISWMQINSNNVIEIITKQTPTLESYSSTLQIGNSNNAELYLNDKSNILLQQIGDYNRLFYNNSFTETEVKTSIITQGFNNIIDITGNNSISENLKLTVKGDNMIIFMRNY
ncbi:hypothetical protein SAMN05444409_0597 [Epilithonimonas zeae]|uniref:Uncharacterized protein n=2 Tax=Epilithonimonas zeae TaxID=1416779 RepID=A0A1N6EGF6_9FLAO|nr:hypothetical protein SAMN05444409_0597 [Epilithonimonas zeae]